MRKVAGDYLGAHAVADDYAWHSWMLALIALHGRARIAEAFAELAEPAHIDLLFRAMYGEED